MNTVTQSMKLTLCELSPSRIEGLESYSPFCLKVHRALRAVGLSYARHHENDPGEYSKINPAAQAPVLLVGDEPVADSSRILARLEALGHRSLLADPDPRVRAEALLWEELADTAINGFVVAARWADDDNWPLVAEAYFQGMPWPIRQIVPGRIRAGVKKALHARNVWRVDADECWTRFDLLLDQLEAGAPITGYWAGASLSVADIAIFAQLHALRNELTKKQRESIATRAALSAYLDRIDRETQVTWVPPTVGRGKHASWAAVAVS